MTPTTSDANGPAVEIPLTQKDRAVVNGAMRLAEGIAALAYGTASEAAEHFAAAERWADVAKQADREDAA